MRKRILKKSEILREGYIKGLKHAQRIIKEMLENDDAELLDTDGRYSWDEIWEWLDKNDVVDDSYETIADGVMLQGDFVVYVEGVGKWLCAEETPLNEWSSCYKVKFFDTTEDMERYVDSL